MIPTATSTLKQKFKFLPTFLSPKTYSTISSNQDLISLLKSCQRTSEITQIHGSMIKTGLDQIPFPSSKLLASSIVDIKYASNIFKHTKNPNQFMFNTMLRGYSLSDFPNGALILFNQMRAVNVTLDEFSFVSSLKSCSHDLAIWFGFGIHCLVIKSGFDLFVNVRNTILHFYCVCGRIRNAHQVFDEYPERRDLVSWNCLMGGYFVVSRPDLVLDLFRRLCRSDSGFGIGVSTVLSVLCAIGDLGDALIGKLLHGYCLKAGFCEDLNVATALISMYGKAGQINSGRKVFDEASVKDVIMWNCLVDSYAKSGLLEESLALIQSMETKGVRPNSSTLTGLLLTCSTAPTGSLKLGQSIHNYVEERQMKIDAVLGTALVDMYSKCGLLEKAIEIFNRMENKDVKSWTAMISAYGVHGHPENAIKLFCRMEEEGYIIPNEVTFLALLSACSHGGLVTEGMRFFERLVKKYGLKPKVEHYGCIVDLLGRAGLLEEAYYLIKSLMPIESDATGWRALLAACRTHGNVDLGEHVKKELERICDEQHPADSIVLSSTYAVVGRIREGRDIKLDNMKEINVRGEDECKTIGVKEAGYSSIELDAVMVIKKIFDTTNNDLNNGQTLNSYELKNKPDGWDTTAKGQVGNIWEMSQREEDISSYKN